MPGYRLRSRDTCPKWRRVISGYTAVWRRLCSARSRLQLVYESTLHPDRLASTLRSAPEAQFGRSIGALDHGLLESLGPAGRVDREASRLRHPEAGSGALSFRDSLQ